MGLCHPQLVPLESSPVEAPAGQGALALEPAWRLLLLRLWTYPQTMRAQHGGLPCGTRLDKGWQVFSQAEKNVNE